MDGGKLKDIKKKLLMNYVYWTDGIYDDYLWLKEGLLVEEKSYIQDRME